jgi:hypothetical protein
VIWWDTAKLRTGQTRTFNQNGSNGVSSLKRTTNAISKCEIEKQLLYGALESAKKQWHK